MKPIAYILLPLMVATACNTKSADQTRGKAEAPAPDAYPSEIINFVELPDNPVFSGTGENTWDREIRERGYILKEEDGYHMWFTGYNPDNKPLLLKLGYAFSEDGFSWTRHPENPIFDESWVEDMMVIKHGEVYYMFAEGQGDVAKMLTSTDRIHWENQGNLNVRQTNGSPISEGPYGTPTVWLEDDLWYLFYERNDLGIWLATSTDMKTWTNVQDDPVIRMGPESYDKFGVALNQILHYKGKYYGYYHGTAFEDWSEWTMNVAISDDLVSWEKYAQNPILEDNKSSGITVHDGEKFRFYTMHPEVVVHFPRE